MKKNKIFTIITLSFLVFCFPYCSSYKGVPSLQEVPMYPYGSLIKTNLHNGNILGGELIAVSDDTVFIGINGKLESVSIKEVESATVVIYRRVSTLPYILWGLAGTISTASHGRFLVLTAPAWILGTILVATIKHNSGENEVHYPDMNFKYISRFSRYPQGIPPGLKDKIFVIEKGRQ